jgi:hypothetical protein
MARIFDKIDATEPSVRAWALLTEARAAQPSHYVAVPATATSTGIVGDYAADASFFYICHATNTWKRVAIATW